MNRLWKKIVDSREIWFFSVNGSTGNAHSETSARNQINKFCNTCPVTNVCILKDPLLTDCDKLIRNHTKSIFRKTSN